MAKGTARFLRRNFQCRFGIHWTPITDITNDRVCPDCGKFICGIQIGVPMPKCKPPRDAMAEALGEISLEAVGRGLEPWETQLAFQLGLAALKELKEQEIHLFRTDNFEPPTVGNRVI